VEEACPTGTAKTRAARAELRGPLIDFTPLSFTQNSGVALPPGIHSRMHGFLLMLWCCMRTACLLNTLHRLSMLFPLSSSQSHSLSPLFPGVPPHAWFLLFDAVGMHIAFLRRAVLLHSAWPIVVVSVPVSGLFPTLLMRSEGSDCAPPCGRPGAPLHSR